MRQQRALVSIIPWCNLLLENKFRAIWAYLQASFYHSCAQSLNQSCNLKQLSHCATCSSIFFFLLLWYWAQNWMKWDKGLSKMEHERVSSGEHNTTKQRAAFQKCNWTEDSRMKQNRHSHVSKVVSFPLSSFFLFFFPHTSDFCGYLYVSVHWTCAADCSRVEWTVTNGCCRAESYCQRRKHIVVEGFTLNPSLACRRSPWNAIEFCWNQKT